MQRKIIDSHTHIFKYIAGFGEEGELRYIGNGMASYPTGKTIKMIPDVYKTSYVSADMLVEHMNKYNINHAMLLQGNFYGFQNEYSYEATKKYPNMLKCAASYDPYCLKSEDIKKHLFIDLGIKAVKFELSVGSGLMANHPDFKLDGDLFLNELEFASKHNLIVILDLGKLHSPSSQIKALENIITNYPNLTFVICHLLAPKDTDYLELENILNKINKPNVYFDTASLTHNLADSYPYPKTKNFLKMAKEIVGSNKILFATDYPSCLKEDSYDNLIKLFEENDSFTNEDLDNIFYNNAYNLFFKK